MAFYLFVLEVAAVFGLLYIFARHFYFAGYVESAKGRIPGFYLSLLSLFLLFAVAIVGITNSLLKEYLNLNLVKEIKHML
ncbi:hypothetical protein FKM82_001303 [Ascaphus truei]